LQIYTHASALRHRWEKWFLCKDWRFFKKKVGNVTKNKTRKSNWKQSYKLNTITTTTTTTTTPTTTTNNNNNNNNNAPTKTVQEAQYPSFRAMVVKQFHTEVYMRGVPCNCNRVFTTSVGYITITSHTPVCWSTRHFRIVNNNNNKRSLKNKRITGKSKYWKSKSCKASTTTAATTTTTTSSSTTNKNKNNNKYY